MNKNELTEYADLVLQAAVRKCDDLADAQDLAQETLLIALTAIENGKEIAEPKNWLMTVLSRKYYDMLREKYRKPTVCIDVVGEIADESSFDDSEESKDKKNKRKEYIYSFMRISPDGSFELSKADTREFLNADELAAADIYDELCRKYARCPEFPEGLIITGGDKYSLIVRTARTTMPNIEAFAKSLRRGELSEELLSDALSAFREDFPEYAGYADRVKESLSAIKKPDFAAVNKCLDFRHNKKAAPALNRYIFKNFGVRINPEIKSQDNDDEYRLSSLCNIKYWYEQTVSGAEALVYYVGMKRKELNRSVHNACVIRKVICENTSPAPEKLFPMMTVEFVRNEQFTVRPFPFKYLREYANTRE